MDTGGWQWWPGRNTKLGHSLLQVSQALHRPSCMADPGRRPVAQHAQQDMSDRGTNHTLQTN